MREREREREGPLGATPRMEPLGALHEKKKKKKGQTREHYVCVCVCVWLLMLYLYSLKVTACTAGVCCIAQSNPRLRWQGQGGKHVRCSFGFGFFEMRVIMVDYNV